jgi:hypothetical protein
LIRLLDIINGDTKATPSAIGRNILKLLDELNALAFSLSVRERSVAQAGPIARGQPTFESTSCYSMKLVYRIQPVYQIHQGHCHKYVHK